MNKNNINSLKKDILENLESNKAANIVEINLEGKSDICNYMIIAEGTSDRHVISIAEKLIFYLKHQEGNIHYASEGLDDGKWVLIDTISIVVHIFHPETREIYDLETLYG